MLSKQKKDLIITGSLFVFVVFVLWIISCPPPLAAQTTTPGYPFFTVVVVKSGNLEVHTLPDVAAVNALLSTEPSARVVEVTAASSADRTTQQVCTTTLAFAESGFLEALPGVWMFPDQFMLNSPMWEKVTKR